METARRRRRERGVALAGEIAGNSQIAVQAQKEAVNETGVPSFLPMPDCVTTIRFFCA